MLYKERTQPVYSDIKAFDQWLGVERNPKGYRTEKEANEVLENIKTEMSNIRGVIRIKVNVVRISNGRYLVHNTTTYDDSDLYRIDQLV